MTFETLYGLRLNLELNDSDSNVLYTTARRQDAINAGVQEFADLTECYVRRSTLAVSCNTAEYALSTITDFSRISEKGLPEYRLTDSNALETVIAGDEFPRRDELWRNRYTAGWQSTTVGMPSGYYLRPDGGTLYIGLDCRPDVGSSETAVLRVPYVALPPTLTSPTDVPFTDAAGATRTDLAPYHQAAVHYAAYKLLPLVGDTEGSKGQLALFMDYVKRFLNNQRPKGGSHVTFQRDYLRRGGDPLDDERVPASQWS